MKQSISAKELTLLAGILVALVVALMLMSIPYTFSTQIPTTSVPYFELPALTKVVVQKIVAFF
jgi:hypothetical protein